MIDIDIDADAMIIVVQIGATIVCHEFNNRLG
jgi:phosphoribosyl-AMP cyclohydrolase